MEWRPIDTFWAEICMAGDLSIAKQVCREECTREGLCVTIHPTEYIYHGGQESGFIIRLINYPRFPADNDIIRNRAKDLGLKLLDRCCQLACLVICPDKTEWIHRERT